jgi:hypothetical protein
MNGKLFDIDTFSGITETFYKDQITGKFAIKKSQNIDGILSANSNEMNSNIDRGWAGDMHKVASIPLVIWEQWINELKAKGAKHCDPAHNSNKQFLIAKLNNRDYSKLRTKQGRV